MSFDQETRNRLAGFVGDARLLLREEFTRQLQNDYGMDPKTGAVSPLESLTALDDSRKETAQILRETMSYYLAGSQGETKDRKTVLERILREQAFTVLNRLCALRMAEARHLILEAVGSGHQSEGFQLYSRLAGSALGETGDAYSFFLGSVFDELAVELPPLFDRYSPEGRLFPRPAALLELLELINDPELEALWGEDETIGWIYQYYNTDEERKQMRKASRAPRNSRELAVRNQFFTPRYVVEFLTDNTLGRTWYEMTQGRTRLVNRCAYLIMRPTEIFLKKGEDVPEGEEPEEGLSQEKLLKKPVYVPYRVYKDPRRLRILDPACGSGHFLLYAFDLLLEIYQEAWEKELSDPLTGQKLSDEFETLDELQQQLPRLIVEHNLHGIDIDPRAVQIAGLSLWMRAQRGWKELGFAQSERPQIRRSQVVCAEPMPGDEEMLEEFLGSLKGEGLIQLVEDTLKVPEDQNVRVTPLMQKALRDLIVLVWDEMELAGEAGSLLKVEETLREAIEESRKQSAEESPLFQVLDYELGAGEKQLDFWDHAEDLVLAALEQYAEEAADGVSYRRRLFTDDAAQGFAFIDLLQEHYDISLLNPPYGDPTKYIKDYLKKNYIGKPTDLYSCFIERYSNLSDYVGSLTSRTFLFFSSFESLRTDVIFPKKFLFAVLDLGFGVLDGARVETCASVIKDKEVIDKQSIFYRLINISDKNKILLDLNTDLENGSLGAYCYLINQSIFEKIDGSPMPYWVGQSLLRKLLLYPQIYPDFVDIRLGAVTSNNEQYLRLRWEVDPSSIDPNEKWASYSKGGDYSKYMSDIHLLVDWRGDGHYIKSSPSAAVRLREIDQYLNKGLTYPLVTDKGINVRVLPSDCVFDNASPTVFCDDEYLMTYLGVLNSRVSELFIRCFTSSRHWQVGYVRKLPFPHKRIEHRSQEISKLVKELIEIAQYFIVQTEPSSEFILPAFSLGINTDKLFRDYLIENNENNLKQRKRFKVLENELEEIIGECYELKSKDWKIIDEEVPILEEGRDQFVGFAFSQKEATESILSWLFGIAFGRWDIRVLENNISDLIKDDPFLPIPKCPPGLLKNSDGLPIKQNELPEEYPVEIPWNGVLVSNESDPRDIIFNIRSIMKWIWSERADSIESEFCQILEIDSLREYYCSPNFFFGDHVKRYSKSKRIAPIYWPLSTPTNSFVIWLYYPRISDQTLYTCINDFVDPYLNSVKMEIDSMKKTRSHKDEMNYERKINIEKEISDFRESLIEIAKSWRPNLEDGVEITAAPLWPLFQNNPWRTHLQSVWLNLEQGEFDWSSLALSNWPERVREKCKSDKSIAIAHDMEHLYEGSR